MKLIIAGGRDFTNVDIAFKVFDKIAQPYDNSEITIISGMARGADTIALDIARDYELDVLEMPANWNKYGKSAGYRRNQDMADRATHLLAFWDKQSRGTKHMIDIAVEAGLKTYVSSYLGNFKTVEKV